MKTNSVLILFSVLWACNLQGEQLRPSSSTSKSKVVTVAQTAPADVLGSDNVALQKAIGLLQAGGTLQIGPGTYQMHNSLFVPSGVTVRGTAGKTVLMKDAGVESLLAEDGDYGERQLRVKEPTKFRPGMGLAVLDDSLNSGWDVSVTTIQEVQGNTLVISPRTERDYDMADKHARVRNAFPVLCAMHATNVILEDLIVEGNRSANLNLDGCRGGAIYLYVCSNVLIQRCVARNYNGDGISFQITEDIRVLDCESFGHSGLGIHPGTGSERPLVKDCRMHDNGIVGLFLCWRVRHGRFENNVIENNEKYGISIGHKDTDNLFINNTVARNGFAGVYFRKETVENSGHRNVFKENRILDNGSAKQGYGFYVEPYADALDLINNRIAETRSENAQTQKYGVYKVLGAGRIRMDRNSLEGHSQQDYFEETKEQ